MNELYNQGMCRINDGNLKEGIELLKQAAGQGYAEAQYQLAKYYFEGSGVEQDDTIAVDTSSTQPFRATPRHSMNWAVAT